MAFMEWLLLGISFALILACGVFGAAEYSLVAVDRTAVEKSAAAGDRRARGVLAALRTLSSQLSGAQIGVTLTNLAIGFLAEPALSTLLTPSLKALGIPAGLVPIVSVTLAVAVATVLTMILGELVPKKLGIAIPMQVALATQAFIRGFTWLMTFPIKALNGSANAVVRAMGIEPQEELRSARSSDELASLATRSATEGTLDSQTAQLVERSVAFGPRTAGEIMTPRLQMSSLQASDTAADVIALTVSTGFSKFPVIKGSADTVIGACHVKQAVAVPRAERSSTTVRDLMVEATVVPESLRLDPLLSLLRTQGFQLAVVSDEYGGTAGVVTLEDVVEEIVGEIADEHDRSASRLRQRPDGSWIGSGLLRPDEVAAETGIRLPEHEAYDTIAGLLVKQLGRIPSRGDKVSIPLPLDHDDDDDEPLPETAVLRVEHMDGLRVDRISIRHLQGQAEGEQS